MVTQKSPKKVPSPGYETDKPLFPSLARLNDELGLQDSAIQLSEVAIQVLIEQAESSDKGARDYLREQFNGRKVPHGTHDFSRLKTFSHGTFIVQTYGVVESVLKRLGREYRQHKWISDEQWLSKDEDDEPMSPLEILLANLPPNKSRLVREKPEVRLLGYYRSLRVSLVHPSSDTKEKAHAEFFALSKNLSVNDYFRKTYELDAPNCPDAVNFDDFRLFTRSFKYLANILNQACDLSSQEISDFVRCRDATVLKLLSGRSQTKPSSIRAYVERVYGPRAQGMAEIDDSTVRFLRQRKKLAGALVERNARDGLTLWQAAAQRDDQFTLILSPRKRRKGGRETEKIPDLSFDAVIERLAST